MASYMIPAIRIDFQPINIVVIPKVVLHRLLYQIHLLLLKVYMHETKIKFVLFERTLEMIKELHL